MSDTYKQGKRKYKCFRWENSMSVLVWLGPVSSEKLLVGLHGCDHSGELLLAACERLGKEDPGPPRLPREMG